MEVEEMDFAGPPQHPMMHYAAQDGFAEFGMNPEFSNPVGPMHSAGRHGSSSGQSSSQSSSQELSAQPNAASFYQMGPPAPPSWQMMAGPMIGPSPNPMVQVSSSNPFPPRDGFFRQPEPRVASAPPRTGSAMLNLFRTVMPNPSPASDDLRCGFCSHVSPDKATAAAHEEGHLSESTCGCSFCSIVFSPQYLQGPPSNISTCCLKFNAVTNVGHSLQPDLPSDQSFGYPAYPYSYSTSAPSAAMGPSGLSMPSTISSVAALSQYYSPYGVPRMAMPAPRPDGYMAAAPRPDGYMGAYGTQPSTVQSGYKFDPASGYPTFKVDNHSVVAQAGSHSDFAHGHAFATTDEAADVERSVAA